jgi:signal transduction histidine kinase
LNDRLSQVYQVLQLVISRTDSYAIETDRTGNVIWMNALAKKRLRLTEGVNVATCMTPQGAEKHNAGFAKAMQTESSMQLPLAIIPECIAITSDGSHVRVSVETWRTPNGAMAFVTEIDDPPTRMTVVE